ncbi:MAG TPA: slipin family protein [bacterium]|nr:slipin family protein [bacterium]
MGGFVFFIMVGIVIILMGLRVVPEGYQGLVTFLGKYARTLNPGLNIVIPFIELVQNVDIREQVMDIPTQEVITNDNVSCMVDGIVRFKVINPQVAIFKVQNYRSQISAKSQTALRDVIGSVTLDEVLAKRADIANHIKTIVDESADKWGMDILAIEIQNIEIPADMKRAMAQQAEADRDRKARIIKAEGEKEAAVKLAEAAGILSTSQGALALRTLQTLKEMSADPSEKIIVALPGDLFDVKKLITDGK